MQAKEKLYRTAEGKLVKEGDPAAAKLAYNEGDEVPDEEARASGLLDAPSDKPEEGTPA